jgi:hypothetical protein
MTEAPDQQLTQLRKELYDAGVATAYARLYGPIAVVAVLIAFQPILEGTYGSLWETAARPAGGPAVLGLFLMFLLVGCLGWATLRPVRTTALPVAIAILAALIALMLITRPGTGSPKASLTYEGNAALAIAVVTIGLAVAHTIHLSRRR